MVSSSHTNANLSHATEKRDEISCELYSESAPVAKIQHAKIRKWSASTCPPPVAPGRESDVCLPARTQSRATRRDGLNAERASLRFQNDTVHMSWRTAPSPWPSLSPVHVPVGEPRAASGIAIPPNHHTLLLPLPYRLARRSRRRSCPPEPTESPRCLVARVVPSRLASPLAGIVDQAVLSSTAPCASCPSPPLPSDRLVPGCLPPWRAPLALLESGRPRGHVRRKRGRLRRLPATLEAVLSCAAVV